MTGRIWRFEIDASRAGEFERYAGDVALPLVETRMGCSAVFALRTPGIPRYAWTVFWVSRKAMAFTLASSEWDGVRREFARFGALLETEESELYETFSTFQAGEKADAPSAPRS
jgi:hypothetical protein